jgi:hypothetical protein
LTMIDVFSRTLHFSGPLIHKPLLSHVIRRIFQHPLFLCFEDFMINAQREYRLKDYSVFDMN